MNRSLIILMCCVIGVLNLSAARPFWENSLPPLPEPLPAVANALELVDARPARKEAKTTDLTLHVSTGDQFSFSAEDVPLRVSTQGPWLAGGKPALYLDLVVTDRANRGLANVAGVAGFVAIRPDDPARMVVARISGDPNTIP